MDNRKLLEQIAIAEKWGTMISHAVPVLKSLDCLGEEHPSYRREIGTIHDAIKEGKSVYSSMSQKKFHPILINLVSAGEETGSLDNSLLTAANVLEKEFRARKENPPYKENIVFYSQLGGMLEYGCSLFKALHVINHSDFFSKIWKKEMKQVIEKIEAGETFSGASSKSRLFEKLDTKIIHDGETIGIFENYLKKLGDYYERLSGYKRQNAGDKIIFYEQLSMLLDEEKQDVKHNLEAVDIIQKSNHLSNNWKKIAMQITDNMVNGDTLPEAMARHGEFKKREIEIIKAIFIGGADFSNLVEMERRIKGLEDLK